MQFRKATLDNGLTVIGELNPKVHSVSVGFYVKAGSRDETDDESGVSHFLEHMAFKGNEQYTAADINRMFDEIGANNNASTSEEITTYHASLLPEYLPRGFELLSVLLYPSLRDDDFNLEKEVIQEEIGMYADQPNWVVYDNLMQAHFTGHPLGRNILGTHESIDALTADQMRSYHSRHYTAGNMVLAVTGKTTWDEVLDLARQYCDAWPAGGRRRDATAAKPPGGHHVTHRENSVQQHIMAMSPGPPAEDDLCFPAQLLTTIVGDSINSRLYWDLIDPGDAESAYVALMDYQGTGAYMTYLCSDPKSAEENWDRVRKVYDEVNKDGVTDEEISLTRSKLAARIVLSSERPRGRRAAVAQNWIYRDEYRSVEDDLATVQALGKQDVRNLLDQYPLAMTTTATVGPPEGNGAG